MAAEDQPLLLFSWRVTRDCEICREHMALIEGRLGDIVGVYCEGKRMVFVLDFEGRGRGKTHEYNSTPEMVKAYLESIGENIDCNRCKACGCGSKDYGSCNQCGAFEAESYAPEDTVSITRIGDWGYYRIVSEINKMVAPGEERAMVGRSGGYRAIELPRSLHIRVLATTNRSLLYQISPPEW